MDLSRRFEIINGRWDAGAGRPTTGRAAVPQLDAGRTTRRKGWGL